MLSADPEASTLRKFGFHARVSTASLCDPSFRSLACMGQASLVCLMVGVNYSRQTADSCRRRPVLGWGETLCSACPFAYHVKEECRKAEIVGIAQYQIKLSIPAKTSFLDRLNQISSAQD